MNIAPHWKLLPLVLAASAALADGFAVDRIYHPYVEAQEREIEWRTTGYGRPPQGGPAGASQMIGFGRSLGERWFGEIYLIGEDLAGESLSLKGYEAEIIHQLTEQGEYWADWGILMELEKERDANAWEASAGVLVEREHGRWSTTANFFLINEWGEDIEDELETRFALQSRLRYRPWFEPGLEIHSAQDTLAAGPLIQGDLRLAPRRNLHWEAGAYVGLDSHTPDHSFRLGVELEF